MNFKKYIYFIIPIILVTLIILGIVLYNKSIPNFAGITFTRLVNENSENIYFGKNKHFSYYGCDGNPIDYYDLCETYTYKDNYIILSCDKSIPEDTITKIEVISYKNDTLKLKFNDEIKTFKVK